MKRECRQCTRHLFYTYSKRKGRSELLGRRASFSLVVMLSRTLKDFEITNELMVREKFTKLFKNCVSALSQLYLHGSGSSGHSSVTDIQLFVHTQELYTLEVTSQETVTLIKAHVSLARGHCPRRPSCVPGRYTPRG